MLVGALRSVVTINGVLQLVPRADKRRAITFIFSATGSATLAIATTSAGATAGSGEGVMVVRVLNTALGPLAVQLRYEDYGELVCNPWFVGTTATVGLVSVIEGFEE